MRWSCLWCNTWLNQRVPGAIDHGGIQDGSLPAVEAGAPEITEQQVTDFAVGASRLRAQSVAAPDGSPEHDPFNADRWAEITDPDDPDYLAGTAMSRD